MKKKIAIANRKLRGDGTDPGRTKFAPWHSPAEAKFQSSSGGSKNFCNLTHTGRRESATGPRSNENSLCSAQFFTWWSVHLWLVDMLGPSAWLCCSISLVLFCYGVLLSWKLLLLTFLILLPLVNCYYYNLIFVLFLISLHDYDDYVVVITIS